MLYNSITALSIATAIHAERLAEAEYSRLVRSARRTTRRHRVDGGISTSRAPTPWNRIPADDAL